MREKTQARNVQSDIVGLMLFRVYDPIGTRLVVRQVFFFAIRDKNTFCYEESAVYQMMNDIKEDASSTVYVFSIKDWTEKLGQVDY